MDGKPLDAYLEKIIQGHINKMRCQRQDVTELCQQLTRMKQFMRDAGKPKEVRILVPKLSFQDLSALAHQNNITFLAGYSDMTFC